MKNSKQNFGLFLTTIFLSLLFFSCKKENQSATAGSWARKADFPGTSRLNAISFTIGNKAYVGLNNFTADFYEYDPAFNTWTRKADFPGLTRDVATGFSIGNKGYVMMGISHSVNLKDVWEYDAGTDTWTQKNDFPGMARYDATGFSIGDKGYFGLGTTDTAVGSQLFHNDWWEYNPATDAWTQKANFTEGRGLATSAAANGKGYVGLGANGYETENDWWEYDPITNTWTRKADFPAGKLVGDAAFSLGSKCYVGNGTLEINHSTVINNDWWEFDVLKGTWTKKVSQLNERFLATAFVINGTGYVGLGYSYAKGNLSDLWEFIPN